MSIPQHSSATQEHYTPADVAERARRVLGRIDLDPASCAEANATIRATAFYAREDDGLCTQWNGTVFLNPPGGLLVRKGTRWVEAPKSGPRGGKAVSSAAVWWAHLTQEYLAGRVESAIFVGFTLEVLRSTQAPIDGYPCVPVQLFPRCYPSARMKFRGASPTHANVIAFLPPVGDEDAYMRFALEFSTLGFCERGAL